MKLYHTQFYLNHFAFENPKTITLIAREIIVERNKTPYSKTVCEFCQKDFWYVRTFNDHMKDSHASHVEVSILTKIFLSHAVKNNNFRKIG